MSVQLRLMHEDEFAAWSEDSRTWYAWDLVHHGGMPTEAAERKAVADMTGAFKEGFATEGNVLFIVEEDGNAIGSVWFAPREQHGEKQAFLYAIKLAEAHRGRGLGRRAMELLEVEVKARGFDRVMLNVFGGNEAARALYRKLGYGEAAVYMTKELA